MSMSIVEVTYSDIPLWLRDSQFFDSLNSDEPDSLISIPVDCFPLGDSVESVDDLVRMLRVIGFWGMNCLPTSVLAFCYSHESTLWAEAVAEVNISEIEVLFRVFKTAGEMQLEVALQTGRQEIVSFWFTKHDRRSKHCEKAIVQTCRFGRLDLVQKLREQGFPISSYAYRAAAQYGHVHVLKYLVEVRATWDYRAMHMAVRGGHLNCVKFLHKHSGVWDKTITMEFAVPQHYATIKSSDKDFWMDDWSILPPAGGYLECLQYALENRCEISMETWDRACIYGLLDCLQLLHQYDIPYAGGSPISAAASAGQLASLQYMHKIGCPFNILASDYAAQHSHLDCLKYILENTTVYQEKHLLQSAASSGNGVACLQYLVEERNFSLQEEQPAGYVHPAHRKNMIKRDNSIFGAAFIQADLPSVQYLINNGCPFKEFVFQKPKYDLVDQSRDEAFVQCIEFAVDHGWKYTADLFTYIEWRNSLPEQSRHLPMCMEFVKQKNAK